MPDLEKNRKFEEALKRLEEIVAALEAPDLSLEEGMRLYREGSLCSRFCREKLEQAKHQLEIWQNDETGLDLEITDSDSGLGAEIIRE